MQVRGVLTVIVPTRRQCREGLNVAEAGMGLQHRGQLRAFVVGEQDDFWQGDPVMLVVVSLAIIILLVTFVLPRISVRQKSPKE